MGGGGGRKGGSGGFDRNNKIIYMLFAVSQVYEMPF